MIWVKRGLMTLGAVALAVILFIAGIFIFTSGAAKSADHFFAVLSEQGIDAAYAAADPGLRSATSEPAFKALMERAKLANWKSSSWNTREIRGNATILKGSVIMQDGRTIEMQTTLVKEPDGWRVLALHFPLPDQASPMPKSAEQQPSASPAPAPGWPSQDTVTAPPDQPVPTPSPPVASGNFPGLGASTESSSAQQETVHKVNPAPSLASRLKGNSIASLQLQNDALPLALSEVASITQPCSGNVVEDTHFERFEADGAEPRPWHEIWLVSGCGHSAVASLHFKPTPGGGTIILTPNSEARVLH